MQDGIGPMSSMPRPLAKLGVKVADCHISAFCEMTRNNNWPVKETFQLAYIFEGLKALIASIE